MGRDTSSPCSGYNKQGKITREEISGLKALMHKVTVWFPIFREMLHMDKLCRKVGFDEE
ncbi:MAG TPA: hypothetical protein IAA79_00685 [Candidatus Avirikenella pullistercoris]|nr:hypothetical protein [Candidatus Avirikenella pullistercoris]